MEIKSIRLDVTWSYEYCIIKYIHYVDRYIVEMQIQCYRNVDSQDFPTSHMYVGEA